MEQFDFKSFKIRLCLIFYIILNGINNYSFVQLEQFIVQFKPVQKTNTSIQFIYFESIKHFSLIRFSFYLKVNHAHRLFSHLVRVDLIEIEICIMASSSSSSNPQWIHDVFINFRGEDTRKNFVSHLYAALTNAGINTFLDDEKLRRGMELEPELLRAIEGSRISIVVFSQNYVNSSWCLKELEEIMKCRRSHGQMVLPVFYNIEPSKLRHQVGGVGKALQSTANRRRSREQRMEDVLSGWKGALTEAANISGWNSSNFR